MDGTTIRVLSNAPEISYSQGWTEEDVPADVEGSPTVKNTTTEGATARLRFSASWITVTGLLPPIAPPDLPFPSSRYVLMDGASGQVVEDTTYTPPESARGARWTYAGTMFFGSQDYPQRLQNATLTVTSRGAGAVVLDYFEIGSADGDAPPELLAPLRQAAASSSSAQPTTSGATGGDGGDGLSGGALAGAIVGAVVGAACLGALVFLWLLPRARRRREAEHSAPDPSAHVHSPSPPPPEKTAAPAAPRAPRPFRSTMAFAPSFPPKAPYTQGGAQPASSQHSVASKAASAYGAGRAGSVDMRPASRGAPDSIHGGDGEDGRPGSRLGPQRHL